MRVITLSCDAMATRFELVLCGEDEARLRAAGEEALEEINRLDAQLSLYLPDSELSRVNARAAYGPVLVGLRLFRLLQTAARIYKLTDGAFDVTIAPLVRCWGFMNGEGRKPSDEELQAALDLVGMRRVTLDKENYTVRFKRVGTMIDLGAIGKGCAVQRAADLLRELGVTSALVHGGTSSAYAIGSPPDGEDWLVSIRDPAKPEEILGVAHLRDSSLSVSAVHGKSFSEGRVEFGHVIDPRTGQPTQKAVLAAIVGPDAAEGDALSTALLVLGEEWLPKLVDKSKGMKGLVAYKTRGKLRVAKAGFGRA